MESRRGGILAGLAAPLSSHGPELAWVLARAFGPAGAARLRAAPPGAGALASRLGLAGRIAARCSDLETALGAAEARQLLFQRLQASATGRELDVAIARVDEVAVDLAIPLCWLKFAALRRRGVLLEGAREARDVDALVAAPRLRELHAALMSAGMRALPGEAPHHLPPLRLDNGAVVELHATVWGLEPNRDETTGADFDDLLAQGALEPVAPYVYLPTDWLLAAHALVHGLVQHRGTPQDYAPLRALCDVVDLRIWHLPTQRVQGAVQRYFTLDQLQVVSELAHALSCGLPPEALEPPMAALLAELLAASLDERFQRAMVLEHTWDLLRAGQLASALRRTFGLGPTPERVGSAPRASWARASRPLQRGLELAQAASAYARLRWSRSR